MCQSAVDWSRCNLVQDACIACAACGLVFEQQLRLFHLQAAPNEVYVCDTLSFVLSSLSVLSINFVGSCALCAARRLSVEYQHF